MQSYVSPLSKPSTWQNWADKPKYSASPMEHMKDAEKGVRRKDGHLCPRCREGQLRQIRGRTEPSGAVPIIRAVRQLSMTGKVGLRLSYPESALPSSKPANCSGAFRASAVRRVRETPLELPIVSDLENPAVADLPSWPGVAGCVSKSMSKAALIEELTRLLDAAGQPVVAAPEAKRLLGRKEFLASN